MLKSLRVTASDTVPDENHEKNEDES
jgi:hypothetical protein